MENEWIEHDGNGAPDLPRGALVHIRARDGFEDTCVKPVPFEHYNPDENDTTNYWINTQSSDDIVAYRVVSK